jgi:hypothetical protein
LNWFRFNLNRKSSLPDPLGSKIFQIFIHGFFELRLNFLDVFLGTNPVSLNSDTQRPQGIFALSRCLWPPLLLLDDILLFLQVFVKLIIDLLVGISSVFKECITGALNFL